MKTKSFIFLMSLMYVFVSVACAGEFSSTGFYYPLKDNSPSFSSCGRWLERGSPNGCYPQESSAPRVYHTGVDMGASQNSSVYAISDGEVRSISTGGWSNGGSTTNVALLIRHRLGDGRNFVAVYGHLKQNSTVQVNQQVTAGQKIGEIGDWVGGDHLHFGILSPGLSTSISGGDYLGRWLDSKYGIKSDGYYDNGFIDPIWFITHNVSDNWISRKIIEPNNPITIDNPWFTELCVNSYDSSCDGSDITTYQECVLEGSTLCAPTISSYSAVNGGDFHSSGSPGGGDSGSFPDFIIPDIWLENQNGVTKTVFRLGEQIKIKAKIKNVGADSPSDITVKFYLSDGYNVDSNKEHIDTATIDNNDLEEGETKTETEDFNVPSVSGIYNITACADTGGNVTEEHESNNCSDEAVFRVDSFGWLVPIIKGLLK